MFYRKIYMNGHVPQCSPKCLFKNLFSSKVLHKINKDYISNFKFNFSWFWWIMSFLRNIEICFALKRSITKDAGAWWSAVNDPRLYVFLFPWMKDVLSQNLHGWCCLSRDCSCLLSLSSFFNTASSSKTYIWTSETLHEVYVWVQFVFSFSTLYYSEIIGR